MHENSFVQLVAQFHSVKSGESNDGSFVHHFRAHLCAQLPIEMHVPFQTNMSQNSFQSFWLMSKADDSHKSSYGYPSLTPASIALMMSAMGFKLSIPLHSVSDFTSQFPTPPLNIMIMHANCMLTV